MRISDWSSDVCSSDLAVLGFLRHFLRIERADEQAQRIAGVLDVLLARRFGRRGGLVLRNRRRGGKERGGEEKGETTHNQSRSEEHTSELQSLMRIPYAAFCLNKKTS